MPATLRAVLNAHLAKKIQETCNKNIKLLIKVKNQPAKSTPSGLKVVKKARICTWLPSPAYPL